MERVSNHRKVVIKTHSKLIDPVHKIEIHVIGAGGTGSQVLQGLARMNYALESLGHDGFHVICHDFDEVSPSNIGRQLFSEHDIGRNKAHVLIEKINRFYGYKWDAQDKEVNKIKVDQGLFYMTCVDKVAVRQSISDQLNKAYLLYTKAKTNYSFLYWMDFGNGKNTGQVTLGSYDSSEYKLNGIEYFGIPESDDLDDTPSCSLAEALTKQDLFINPMVSNTGMTMLWSMLTTLKVSYNAAFINLERMKITSSLNFTKNVKTRKKSCKLKS